LLVGPWLATDFTASLDVDVAATLRAPLLHDAAAIHLTVAAGWSPYGAAAWNSSVRIGPWLAMTPTWGVQLELGLTLRGLHERDVFVTLGITRL
ncbi:MAG: hypothetical protein H0T79_13245, partial [Deltaproteobacteria bacterium]|nr:hypothetical protein [Deltaproteobacteria bacterium]